MKSKKEFIRTKNRKFKKRISRKNFIDQINLTQHLTYSLFTYFVQKEKMLLNRKILMNIFITENGTLFVFEKWAKFFYKKIY